MDADRWALDVDGALIHRAADDRDLDAAVEILEEVARWGEATGYPSWEPGQFRSLAGRHRVRVQEALANGDLYVARVGGEPAATISLFEIDEVFWPGAPRDALYVHKLAVGRSFGGLGLGGSILRWADERATSKGKAFLRLNCAAEQPRIRRYYEEAGFVHRGDRTANDFRAALYERPVAPRG